MTYGGNLFLDAHLGYNTIPFARYSRCDTNRDKSMTSQNNTQKNTSSRTHNNNVIIILTLALAVLLCCLIFTFFGTAFFLFNRFDSPSTFTPTATQRPIPTLSPLPTPIISDKPAQTNVLLREVQVPSNDPIDLAARLRPELGVVPKIVSETSPNYQVGDVITFWVGNSDTDENWQIDAELLVKSEHLYMWGEAGADVNVDDLQRSANFFDSQIYPTNREFFGSEWSPGIDGDSRLHVLHASDLGVGVAGYFSSADETSNLINPFSNEKEMFYINIDNTFPGEEFYNGVLAHEFQHMIHWYQDLNETTWLNEGASELAMQLNGLKRSENSFKPDQEFAENPDLQLNTWPDSEESYAHYGNSYLFMNYFLSRFGEKATQALIADPANSVESVDDVVQGLGLGLSGDDVFADWFVANWLDAPSQDDGRWGYPDYDPDPMAPAAEHRRLPAQGGGEVHQYATDYITIAAEGDATIAFEGTTMTQLAPTEAYSGDWAWWSHRVDSSDTRLTLPVDLTDVDEATLRFRTWYDIEDLWDYAYVGVSTDGGATWTLLESDRTTRENPNGNAYGPGYTGVSGGSEPTWVLEEIDLSSYAGQPVQIRFEYVTDLAVTQPGMFIDDVAIPEIGYFEDFEDGPGQWQAEGWLLTDNILDQRWIVQVIETMEDGSVQVHRLSLGPDGKGSLTLTGVSSSDLILAVSALAPVTVEQASYRYRVTSE